MSAARGGAALRLRRRGGAARRAATPARVRRVRHRYHARRRRRIRSDRPRRLCAAANGLRASRERRRARRGRRRPAVAAAASDADPILDEAARAGAEARAARARLGPRARARAKAPDSLPSAALTSNTPSGSGSSASGWTARVSSMSEKSELTSTVEQLLRLHLHVEEDPARRQRARRPRQVLPLPVVQHSLRALAERGALGVARPRAARELERVVDERPHRVKVAVRRLREVEVVEVADRLAVERVRPRRVDASVDANLSSGTYDSSCARARARARGRRRGTAALPPSSSSWRSPRCPSSAATRGTTSGLWPRKTGQVGDAAVAVEHEGEVEARPCTGSAPARRRARARRRTRSRRCCCARG